MKGLSLLFVNSLLWYSICFAVIYLLLLHGLTLWCSYIQHCPTCNVRLQRIFSTLIKTSVLSTPKHMKGHLLKIFKHVRKAYCCKAKARYLQDTHTSWLLQYDTFRIKLITVIGMTVLFLLKHRLVTPPYQTKTAWSKIQTINRLQQ